MLDIFKKLKEQKEEIERLSLKYSVATNVSENYCGWVFAYRNAIVSLSRDGGLTKEQSDLLFSRAKEYYDYWQTR